jgi:ribose-phosphate pyrophosphokinase
MVSRTIILRYNIFKHWETEVGARRQKLLSIKSREKHMKKTIHKELHIFAGSHYPELAEKVAKQLGISLSPTQLQHFANGESKCQLDKSVRGADVFIFQSHSGSVGEAIMEQAITAVCPFLGYARQDRKSYGREPITARLVIDILRVAGADRIVSVDLHTGQIQGFFDGPFDHLISLPVLADHLKHKFGHDFVIVSPDAGRVKLAERYASRLGVDLAIVHKSRVGNNQTEALDVIGEVEGRNCVIIDDMIDTAGTISAASAELKAHGAKSVSAIGTHGLFSEPALERIKNSSIDHLAVTDTLPFPTDTKGVDIEVVSIVPLLASAIKAIFEEGSVSALFNGENQS